MTSSTNNDGRLETVAEVAAINNFDEVVHETEVADIFDEIEHTKLSTTLRLKLCTRICLPVSLPWPCDQRPWIWAPKSL